MTEKDYVKYLSLLYAMLCLSLKKCREFDPVRIITIWCLSMLRRTGRENNSLGFPGVLGGISVNCQTKFIFQFSSSNKFPGPLSRVPPSPLQARGGNLQFARRSLRNPPTLRVWLQRELCRRTAGSTLESNEMREKTGQFYHAGGRDGGGLHRFI